MTAERGCHSSGCAILQPRSAPDGLTLSNPTDPTIYYAIFEGDFRLLPRSPRSPGYYWLLVGSKGGYRVADLRTIVVPF